MSDPLFHLVFLVTGGAAGFAAGLLGIGGGLIIVPVLLLCFTLMGTPDGLAAPLALGTSLASVGLIAAVASRRHLRRGLLVEPFSARTGALLLCLALGVIGGGLLTTRAPAAWTLALLASYQVLMALHLFRGTLAVRQPTADAGAPDSTPPQARLQRGRDGAFVAFTGFVSSLCGIGGATLLVPWFLHAGIDIRRAGALSTWFGCAVGLTGFVAYGLLSRPPQALPLCLGYVHLPALASMTLGSLLMVDMGARLAARLPAPLLTRGFCVFLAASATKTLVPLVGGLLAPLVATHALR